MRRLKPMNLTKMLILESLGLGVDKYYILKKTHDFVRILEIETGRTQDVRY